MVKMTVEVQISNKKSDGGNNTGRGGIIGNINKPRGGRSPRKGLLGKHIKESNEGKDL